MRVLVTGAGGNLGRATLPALADAGHEPRALDFRPLDSPFDSVRGDVRDVAAVSRALHGIDAVVHAAALHGIHLKAWPPEEFWSINATGTFTVYEAARVAGVARVVFASSMGVYGRSLEATSDAWAWVHEGLPELPVDVYGLTKLLGEAIGRHYARANGMSTVALRLGMYVPATFEHYGFRLLFGGVDERDVAQAVLRSLTYEPDGGFDAFDIMSATPFGPDDARALHADPLGVLERYWPGCLALFAEKRIDPAEQMWGRFLWPTDKARDKLGYRPRYNFEQFLEALAADDAGRYPFLGLPHWGVSGTGG